MLRLYNSLTKRKEEFEPLETGHVKIYNCGPTVYSYAHLGNFRSWVAEDLLRRYLEYKGYRVTEVMNITDVGHMTSDFDYGEDKMELAAKKEKKSPEEIARFYEHAFHADAEALNILPASIYPRATDHIEEMIELVQKLIEGGYAYVSQSSVYYDVTKFKDYGMLSGNTLEKLKAGARIDINPEKRNPWDFALWIYDPNHLMHWRSPWSDHGYPGWHLECSVMSMKYLGETFDIHAGGEDNKFPHHECEIAQSEAASGRKFVNYWLHVKHLIVEGDKMSKSKGNYYTLRDLLEKGYDPRAIRYLLLSAYYRQQLNLTFQGLDGATSALARIDEFISSLKQPAFEGQEVREVVSGLCGAFTTGFEHAMDDDLNISSALASVHDFIRNANSIEINSAESNRILTLILDLDRVLGLGLTESTKDVAVPPEVQNLVSEREVARKAKDFNKADRLREEVKQRGFRVEDTPSGPKVRPIR